MRDLLALLVGPALVALAIIAVTIIRLRGMEVAREQPCISACQTAGGNGNYSHRVERIDGKTTRTELLCFTDDDKLIVIPSPN